MRNIISILLTLAVMAVSSDVLAVSRIEVQALFGGKAMVMIDDQRRTLSIGQTSPEGVKLIDADSKQAVLEVDGKQKTYKPGGAISLSYAKPEHHEEKIYAGIQDNGFFFNLLQSRPQVDIGNLI